MKKNTKIYHFINQCFLACFMLIAFTFVAHAQKAFTQRTSTKATAPHTGKSIYNLRGDFEMMGNTNLVKVPYDDTSTNNGTTMGYVDIDGDATTANSSAAYLNIPNDGCTKVVYAGLYWSGRAQASNNPNQYTFDIPFGQESLGPNASVNVYNNTSNISYALNITRGGVNDNRYPIYTLTLGTGSGSKTFVIYLTNNTTTTSNTVTNNRAYYYEDGSNTPVNIPGNYNTSSGRFTFTNALSRTVNGNTYAISSLDRNTDDEGNNNSYTNNDNYVTLNAPTIVTPVKTLDKRKVKIKKEGGVYQEVTALDSDIYYPNTSTYDYIYAGYVDVTDIVNSSGKYYVADLALKEGSTPGPGYSGGWGMIVIYENPTMKWRDITLFDGHAYVSSGSSTVNKIALSGFKAAQAGAINVDMGFLAAEGENKLTGDYFRMKRADLTTTTDPTNSNINNSSNMNNPLSSAHGTNMLNYPFITTTGTTRTNNNFFNSSIYNGYGPTITLPNSTQVPSRTPHYINNYGFDLAKIKLDNADKKFIKNSQTATTFYYGTNGDTYVIYNVVFAVDAYVPEVESFNQTISIFVPQNGSTPSQTITNAAQVDARLQNLQPGDEVTYTSDLFNYGSDVINNAKIEVNIPPAMKLISSSMQPSTQAVSGASSPFTFSQPQWVNPTTNTPTNVQPATSEGGILRWVLGTIPTQTVVPNLNNRVPLAKLTYKLKVTNNCVILRSSVDDCAEKPEINGTVTGVGANSGENLNTELIIGYNTDCNNTPVYGGIAMQIKPSAAFLADCSEQLPTQNGVVLFKKFCQASNNEILRSEILGVNNANYPLGTVFYSTLPTDANPVVVDDNFSVNTDGTLKYYYAVTPGSNMACYLKLATQLDVITQTPIISNVDVCFGISYTLNPTVSTQDPGTSFYYFDNNSTTPLTTAPQPTKRGVYTYQVALGKVQSGTPCYGPKAIFTITIRNCKTPVNPMIYTPLKR